MFQLELSHALPSQSQGPELSLIQGSLKDWRGEGEAFYKITFWSLKLSF